MITLIFALFAFAVCFCTAVDRPNIVFILADDLGWNDVAFHGSNQIQTPNIDALAYSGIILQNYHTLPICTPSRSALMTGMHPIHTGMQRIIYAGEPWGLPLDVKILPQYLKDDGYKTHAVGKWHLGFFRDVYTPTKRGFDTHFGYYTGKQDYYDHTSDIGKLWGYDMRRGMNVSWESYGNYTTDLITDEAVARIRQHDPNSPMFLYVAHLAVHSANSYQFLEAPKDVIKKFSYIKNENRRTYAAMLWKLDESVGKIVDALQQQNMLNNTIIVFSTDNGGAAAGFNNNAASNWPLRGVKDTLWEGGVRGSAFIWSPLLPKSRVNHELMHIQDWLPTFLNAINSTATKSNLTLDGRNMWNALKGDTSNVYDELVLQIDPGRKIYALKKGDWKILSGDPYNGKWNGQYGPSGRNTSRQYDVRAVKNSLVARALKKNNIPIPSKAAINEIRKNASIACDKISARGGSPCQPKVNVCLFNVRNDPCEQTNLAKEKPEILQQLSQVLQKYTPVEPRNKPTDPKSNPKFWNYTWTNWMDFQ